MKKFTKSITMNKILTLLLLTIFATFGWAATKSVAEANRKSALRCLKTSMNYLLTMDYKNAGNFAQLGLGYDEAVSDLWYVKARAACESGATRAQVKRLMKKAMDKALWLDYNYESARVLYAQVLCDTNEEALALDVLNSETAVYNKDAELIRVKALYKQFSKASIEAARQKLDISRKVFPNDERFPIVFFKYENILKEDPRKAGALARVSKSSGELCENLKKYFIEKVADGTYSGSLVRLQAAIFSEKSERTRGLKAFNSLGDAHPLFAKAALEAGILKDMDAWNYLCTFMSRGGDAKKAGEELVTFDTLIAFLKTLKNDKAKKAAKEFLEGNDYTLAFDDDGDGEIEAVITYKRGRPESFFHDANNDDVADYKGVCDFGNVKSLTAGGIKFSYNNYPRVEKAEAFGAVFTIPHDQYNFDACKVEEVKEAKEAVGASLFVMSAKPFSLPSAKKLLSVAGGYTIGMDKEGVGNYAQFAVANGVITEANYFRKTKGAPDVLYSKLTFKNGLAYKRTIDMDKDGKFDTVKTYDTVGQVVEPESAGVENLGRLLYGIEDFAPRDTFVKSIECALHNGNIVDYKEEYGSYGEKTIMWDQNADKKWDVRYHRFPKKTKGEELVEESQFYTNDGKLVRLRCVNSIPQKVQKDTEELAVTQGKSKNFFWLETPATDSEETYILEHFAHLDLSPVKEGVNSLIESTAARYFVIKVAGNIYAHLVGGGGKED